MDWTMNDAPAIAAHHLRPVTHFHLNGSKSKFNRTNLIETPTYDSLASLVATHRRLFLDEIHSGFSRSGFFETGFSESCYRIWRDFWEASVSGFFVIFFFWQICLIRRWNSLRIFCGSLHCKDFLCCRFIFISFCSFFGNVCRRFWRILQPLKEKKRGGGERIIRDSFVALGDFCGLKEILPCWFLLSGPELFRNSGRIFGHR